MTPTRCGCWGQTGVYSLWRLFFNLFMKVMFVVLMVDAGEQIFLGKSVQVKHGGVSSPSADPGSGATSSFMT